MTEFLRQLFSYLNNNCNYAVLRNYDGLPEQLNSRDIDVLITKDELKQLCEILPKLLQDTGCKKLYSNEDYQFFTIVIKDQNNQLLQLDFQYNFAWMGIDLLNEIEVLQHRIFNGKIYHLNAMYTFLPKYLCCRILGAKYPEKYRSVRDAALCESSECIEQILNYLSLNKGGIQYWDIANKWTLRLRAFAVALLHKPHRALFHLFCFVYWIIKSLLLRRGLMISFTGPDGCGKTTVIDLLQKRFIINPPELFHFRPSVLPNLGEVGAKAGIIKEVDRDFSKPHRGKKRNILSSLIRLMYYMFDYTLGYLIKILPLRLRKYNVFFDRYFTDIIVDHERSSIFLSHKFIAPLRYLVPRCQYNFLLRVDPDTILQRKQELSRDAIDRIYSRMQYLAERDKRYFWINNNGSPEDAVAQILNIIAEHNRNAKKI